LIHLSRTTICIPSLISPSKYTRTLRRVTLLYLAQSHKISDLAKMNENLWNDQIHQNHA
jgi:hypothetical protein